MNLITVVNPRDENKEVQTVEGTLVFFDTRNENQISPYHIKPYGHETFQRPILISKTEKVENRDMVLVTPFQGITDVWEYSPPPCPLPYWGNAEAIDGKVLVMPHDMDASLFQSIMDGSIKEGDVLLLDCTESHNQRTPHYRMKHQLWITNPLTFKTTTENQSL